MKQVRFVPNDLCGLQVREDENGQQSRVVQGRAIVFGQRSVNLTPWSSTRVVFEVLEPGCLTQELLNRSDVVYNLNHNSNVVNVLGRFRNSEKDTLKLRLAADGVYNECDLPNTNNANDALELIKRGDINGQSFAFEDDWEDTENGVSYERTNETVDGKEVWIRHVKRITGLYDVSIVTHPAYEQTNVGTREQSEAIDKAIEEQLKREQHQETEEEKQAREAKEREANGGETNAEKAEREAREAQEREANGGETNAEKEAREAREQKEREEKERKEKEERELEEQAQRFREERMLRLRGQRRRREIDIESLNY
jgi:HK97 family phage prohead protease